jgi:hypothetical protein
MTTATRPLDPDTAARIAAEWGVPADTLPPVKVCPPNTWAEDLAGWRDLRQMQFRMMVRRNKFAALAEREGRT